MITYLIISFLLIAFLATGIKGFIKERRYRQRQRGMAKAYERLVRQFKLAVEYSEFFCHRYIGLDRKNKKLVLIDHCGNETQEQCLCLYEIGESRIIHIKDEFQNIKTILIELRNKYSNQPVRFCFYDKEHDPLVELPSLSKKAIHWKTRIDIHKHAGPINFEAEFIL